MSDQTTSVPLVDFSRFLDGSPEDRKATATQIDRAFQDSGFVYLSNHGVPLEKVAKCFEWSEAFFALPYETKMKAPHPPGGSHHRGYSGLGKEKVTQMVFDKEEIAKARADAPDVKESFESGNGDDRAQPNIWLPEEDLPGFRGFMEEFFQDCSKLVHSILDALTLGLDLPPSLSLSPTHADSLFQLRLLHYPPIPRSLLTSGARQRISAHSDFGTLTLLFQDNVGGLEIEDPQRPWVFNAVPPKEGTVVVNIADLMERWSNGRWKSTVHRVQAPAGDQEEDLKSRYSIPFFAVTDTDAMVECLPGTWSENVPKKYAAVTTGQYVQMRMAALYN